MTEVDRKVTLLGKRIKTIGLDSRQAAIDYSKRMHVIHEGIVQNVEHPETTRVALEEADVPDPSALVLHAL